MSRPGTFPELDLPPAQHARARAALVQEAGARTRTLNRFAVPIAAIAATAAIVSGGIVADRWHSTPEPSRPAPVVPDTRKVQDGHAGQCNETRPGRPADAKGLSYVLDVPEGWTAKAEVNLVRYCAEPIPVASYSDGKGAGFQLFRGFSTRIVSILGDGPGSPSPDLTPLDDKDTGANVDVPFTSVDVGGVPGRLIRNEALAWQVDGQWWTALSFTLGGNRLRDFAAELVLDGRTGSWPGAKAAGFTRDVPDGPFPELKEGSWQPEWKICLKQKPGKVCSITFRSAHWEYWSPSGERNWPEERAILKAHHGTMQGAGHMIARTGVIWMASYASDAAVYRHVPGTAHLVPVTDPAVTRLLKGFRS